MSRVFFQAGEVCLAGDCQFADDGNLRGQCFGKNPKRDYVFSCDLDALKALYERGAERERERSAEALKRKN